MSTTDDQLAAQKAANRDKHKTAIARAEACLEGPLRTNVIANLEADAYARPQDLEADLRALEDAKAGHEKAVAGDA